MSFLSQAVTVIQTIYAGFFAWMPWQLYLAFSGIMFVAVVITVLRIIAAVLNAIPFL